MLLGAFIVPYGTEKGEELTNVPNSGLFCLAAIVLAIITLVIWFRRKSPEDKKEEESKEII
ncbi:MAG: hypothetical protein NY202_04380 [Mollicutes bacterium UO1]